VLALADNSSNIISSQPVHRMEKSKMPDEADPLLEMGAFEPADAKHLLPQLEAAGIPFEIETDNSALLRPGRTVAMVLGMYPEGSKIVVSVPASVLDRANAIAAKL
jgi:hypothetical protein